MHATKSSSVVVWQVGIRIIETNHVKTLDVAKSRVRLVPSVITLAIIIKVTIHDVHSKLAWRSHRIASTGPVVW